MTDKITLLNNIRKIHPSNSEGARNYFNSKFLTKVTESGLYVERTSPTDSLLVSDDLYHVKMICCNRFCDHDGVKLNAIITVDSFKGMEGLSKSKNLINALVRAYRSAGHRELYAWNHAFLWEHSETADGVYKICYCDESNQVKTVEVDTDRRRTASKRYWVQEVIIVNTYSQLMEMLDSIQVNPKVNKFMVANGVIVQYDGDGFCIYAGWKLNHTGELVAFSKTKKDTIKYISEYYQEGWYSK